MIINALYRHYEMLRDDPDSGISEPGYCKAKIAYAIVISKDGNLVNILDLRDQIGKRLVPREMTVPEQVQRTSGIAANFLCDNCTYVLGLTQKGKKKERSKEAFRDFVDLHQKILGEVHDEGASAILHFLSRWDIDQAASHPKLTQEIDGLLEGGNIVFRLEGTSGYIHQRPPVMAAWDKFRSKQSSEFIAQCLVTGNMSPIARTHPSIRGVTGAQSSGAALVSFNARAFESYDKDQSYNSPVSEKVAFAYTTATNHLLSNRKHRIRIGDTTTVFWAERSATGVEEDLLGALFFPEFEGVGKQDVAQGKVIRDPQTVQLLHDIFAKIRVGAPISRGLSGIDSNVKFHILGIAPNAGRLSIRFWHVDRYGNFLDRIAQHYIDLAIEKPFVSAPDFIPISMILTETAPLRDAKRIPPLLGGVLMRSVLTGLPYPQVLYNSIISRIRADQTINYTRAAIIKACLARKNRYNKVGNEVRLTMTLDLQNTKPAYMLGRLFALLEKAQEDANPGLNATIRDRYFGAASASPASVFPILLRLAQHHLAKSEYGCFMDKRIEEVICSINNFPAYLNLEEQGLFVLGYYHQRQALFTKSDKKRGKTDD